MSPALVHAVVNSSLDARKLKYRDGSAGFHVDGFYDFAEPLADLNDQVCYVHANLRDARRAHVFVRGRRHELRCRVLEQRWREVPTQRVWTFTQELRDMRPTQMDYTQKVEQRFDVYRLQMEAILDQEQRQRAERLAKVQTPSEGEKTALAAGPRTTQTEMEFRPLGGLDAGPSGARTQRPAAQGESSGEPVLRPRPPPGGVGPKGAMFISF